MPSSQPVICSDAINWTTLDFCQPAIMNNQELVDTTCVSETKRSGTVWTALAHIITAVIGSGVLSLAWSISQLGWIAAPLTMLAFASVTLTSALLLCNCYKSSDPDNGFHRNASYLDAVRRILGKKSAWVCGIIVRINFIKLGIVYTITSAISMRAIQRSNCLHNEGHTAACKYGNTYFMLIFGLIQVIVSQIPDFRNTEWLSVIAAIMSFSYSIIGSALGLAKVIENEEIKGSIGGVPTSTAAEKVWSISQALGDIAFAFPFSVIFLEVMDTLKSTPPEKVTMKKASIMAACITTFFNLCCGGFGYAAFGNSTPGNILTGFGFYEPYWLIDFANACVVLHLVGGYQVFSQPLYASIEQWFAKKFPNSRFVHGELKHMPALRLNLLRLCFRTCYVGFTTGFAMLFPYFNQVVGVAGAINFWPVVVYFPVEMYLVQKNISPRTNPNFAMSARDKALAAAKRRLEERQKRSGALSTKSSQGQASGSSGRQTFAPPSRGTSREGAAAPTSRPALAIEAPPLKRRATTAEKGKSIEGSRPKGASEPATGARLKEIPGPLGLAYIPQAELESRVYDLSAYAEPRGSRGFRTTHAYWRTPIIPSVGRCSARRFWWRTRNTSRDGTRWTS